MCNNHNQAKGLRELIKLSTKEKCFDLLSNSNDLSVADQGEPAPPPPPPVIFGSNWGPKGRKKKLRPLPLLSQGLDDHPLPPYLKDWIRHGLLRESVWRICMWILGHLTGYISKYGSKSAQDKARMQCRAARIKTSTPVPTEKLLGVQK